MVWGKTGFPDCYLIFCKQLSDTGSEFSLEFLCYSGTFGLFSLLPGKNKRKTCKLSFITIAVVGIGFQFPRDIFVCNSFISDTYPVQKNTQKITRSFNFVIFNSLIDMVLL